MEKNRDKRYLEKAELAEERFHDIEVLLENFDNKFSRLACYKAFQEAVEALFDIIAMLLKDAGKIIEDNYTNVGKLEDEGIVSREQARILKEANGLRNRVVHKYNKTDDRVAEESMKNLLPDLRSILRELMRR